MIEVFKSLLDRLETLSGDKVQEMERIAQRNGFGEDLEKLILMDTYIYDIIQQMQSMLEVIYPDELQPPKEE